MDVQNETKILERENLDEQIPQIEAIEALNVDQNGDDCLYCAGRPTC